jgi:hypothetical protein
MIFDKPIYENLNYEYIDYIYYYLLQKTYNGIISHLHHICYEKTQESHEKGIPLPEPIPTITIDFYTLYFNFTMREHITKKWEKIFSPIEIELHYFYDIHKEYYKEFEQDEYPDHPTHPSNKNYITLQLYSTTIEENLDNNYFSLKYSNIHSPLPTSSQIYQPPESKEKHLYINKIKNRIVLDVRKLFTMDFQDNYRLERNNHKNIQSEMDIIPSSVEQSLVLPSHILSIFKHLPPNSIYFYNYVANKTTCNYFLEAMTISNIMLWL